MRDAFAGAIPNRRLSGSCKMAELNCGMASLGCWVTLHEFFHDTREIFPSTRSRHVFKCGECPVMTTGSLFAGFLTPLGSRVSPDSANPHAHHQKPSIDARSQKPSESGARCFTLVVLTFATVATIVVANRLFLGEASQRRH